MDSKTVTAFVASVQGVFESMLQMSVEVGSPSIKESPSCTYDVSGIIGMSGGVEGNVVLSLPVAVAERIVSTLVGATVSHEDEDFGDAIGELINMIAGSAKARFETAEPVNITCPSVVFGSSHGVLTSKGSITVVIPCTCDCGEFAIEVALQKTAVSAGATETQQASV